jgi:hypothetical protein
MGDFLEFMENSLSFLVIGLSRNLITEEIINDATTRLTIDIPALVLIRLTSIPCASII